MQEVAELFKAVESIYLKIYYSSEKEYQADASLRTEIDRAIGHLINIFKPLQAQLQQYTGVEWIYYTDIVSFWEDAERRKNNRHAWLILSEYIPAMYKEITDLKNGLGL